jgi:hypothetical protein
VVNSAINPEAVDMPPRLSAEASPPAPEKSPVTPLEPSASETKRESKDGAISSPVSGPAGPTNIPEPTAKSPVSDKPLGFKEIVNIKSSAERIDTYNRTRDYWANADHGLNDWIASAMAANPELASQSLAQPRLQLATSGTTRHKPTGSISLFGKHVGGASSNQQQPPTYFEQYNSAASQVPTTPTPSSAAPEARPSVASPGGQGGRSASHQFQGKGKDLLHTAEVLGGKGMKGAKGLFAKGKSRFRGSGGGDKV